MTNLRRYLFPALFLLVLVLPAVVARFMKPDGPPPAPAGSIKLDVVSPHNQDIRNAFAPAFSAWHKAKYGRTVDLNLINIGGTGDISRMLRSNYSAAMQGGKLPENFSPPAHLAWGGGDAFFDREIKEFLQPITLPPGTLEAALPQPILNGVLLYDYHEPQATAATLPASSSPSAGSSAPTGAPAPAGTPEKPRWVGVCISSFGIVYNPDVYTRLSLPPPQTWKDLAREELAGWIALANPLSSSSAATAYSMDYQRAMADEEATYLKDHPELAKLKTAERMKDPGYLAAVSRGWSGDGELLLVSANARYITDSGSQPPNDVANGDAAAAMAIDFYGRANEFAMGEKRFKLLFPRGAAAMNPDPVGILAGVKGEHLDVANHFVEYLLSPEGQRLWQLAPGTEPAAPARALYRSPIRRDAYDNRTHWTNPSLNPYEDDSGFFMRSEWMSLFSEIRFLWAVSWIDARDELKSAYKAIRANPDPARREQLRAQLADFPVEYDDLVRFQQAVRKMDKKAVDPFKASERIRLANLFREHYRKVEAAAKDETASR